MATTSTADDLARWLGDRTLGQWREELDEVGFVIVPEVLSPDEVDRIREALGPHLEADVRGRNDFEGFRSNRVYAMLAKSPVFADLVLHPLAMAFAEAELGTSLLLSACLAINLQPGETAQPWHFDDAHLAVARPRESWGISTFWAIDDCTDDNGATEVLPGSHRWGAELPAAHSAADADVFVTRRTAAAASPRPDDPGARPDAVRAVMPSGSLMVAHGTLWHRGGANRSGAPRLIVTPQYCPGWSRQLENMVLAVPPDVARHLPARARELLGYSIHPPFMGYVDGRHPRRLVEQPGQ